MHRVRLDYWLTIPCIVCGDVMYGGWHNEEVQIRVYNCNGCQRREIYPGDALATCVECHTRFVTTQGPDYKCPDCREKDGTLAGSGLRVGWVFSGPTEPTAA